MNKGKFEVIRGKYYKKTQTCKHCGEVYQVPEEKRTDVNIAVHLLGDCTLNSTDSLVVITADSDIVPPIVFIQEHYPDKRIRIYFPPKVSSFDLKNISKKKPVYLENNKIKFQNSIMEDIVHNSDKTEFATRPSDWK